MSLTNVKRVNGTQFKRLFPELNGSCYDIEDILYDNGIEYYSVEEKTLKIWERMLLPIAVIVYLLLLINIPFKYMITGKYNYKIDSILIKFIYRILNFK